jgi:hypothetical protein
MSPESAYATSSPDRLGCLIKPSIYTEMPLTSLPTVHNGSAFVLVGLSRVGSDAGIVNPLLWLCYKCVVAGRITFCDVCQCHPWGSGFGTLFCVHFRLEAPEVSEAFS